MTDHCHVEAARCSAMTRRGAPRSEREHAQDVHTLSSAMQAALEERSAAAAAAANQPASAEPAYATRTLAHAKQLERANETLEGELRHFLRDHFAVPERVRVQHLRVCFARSCAC